MSNNNSTNPLISNTQYFIPFNKINIEHLKSAIDHYIDVTNKHIQQTVTNNEVYWEQNLALIYDSSYQISSIWNIAIHLLAVKNTQELRDFEQQYQKIITEFYISFYQNISLYNKCYELLQKYLSIKDKTKDQMIITKILELEIKEFKMNGILLKDQQQIAFKKIVTRLDELESKFAQNVLDSNNSFKIYLTKELLLGVPDEFIGLYKNAADNENNKSNKDNKNKLEKLNTVEQLYKITLHMSDYLPIMKYCKNYKLRNILYYHYITRASALAISNKMLGIDDDIYTANNIDSILDKINIISQELIKLESCVTKSNLIHDNTSYTQDTIGYEARENLSNLSEYKDKKYNNTPIIVEILQLRHQLAQILNFDNYVQFSLFSNKMVNKSTEIYDLLNNLANKSKLRANDDIRELLDLKTLDFMESNNEISLYNWDIAYYSEQLKTQKYNYSSIELQNYFMHTIVIKGIFELLNTLYAIYFVPVDHVDVWHDDVLVFAIYKNKPDLEQDQIIAYLYMDLFTRDNKKSGAWMNSAWDKHITQEAIEFIPMAYVVCNFAPKIHKAQYLDNTNNLVSLLTFDDVQTLFHEVGHAINHIVSVMPHYKVSGMNNVEWDAIELPSQFMEYFTWNQQILSSISRHITTNETLPITLYNKLLQSKYFQAGLQIMRQIEFAIFDLEIHQTNLCDNNNNGSKIIQPGVDDTYNMAFNKQAYTKVLDILNNIRKQYSPLTPIEYNRFSNTFCHIFSGAYAAGYYSYKWAEVLACDIFAIFDQAMQKDTHDTALRILGQKFIDDIIGEGSLYCSLDNFKKFMQRSPSIEALLKQYSIN